MELIGRLMFHLYKIRSKLDVFGYSMYKSITSSIISSSFVVRNKTTIELPYPKLSDISDRGISQKKKGKIYDKKPFKYHLIKGKKYNWCVCGWSKSQPFCDGTHNNPHMRITLKPVIFVAPETGDYWLCNCKQTSQRPFCDGTHRQTEIQEAIRS